MRRRSEVKRLSDNPGGMDRAIERRSIWMITVLALTIPIASSAELTAESESEFEQSFLTELGETTDKLFQLAEVVPVEAFEQRPHEGVRSLRETYVHLAAANFVVSQALGIEPTVELDFRPEGGGLVFAVESTITDKAEVVDFLRRSLDHVRQAAASASSQDLGEKVAFFGIERERRRILMGLITHHSQHLGQCVAYARQLGIVPPWTAAALARQR